MDTAGAKDLVGVSLSHTPSLMDASTAVGVFTIQCFNVIGSLEWETSTKNLLSNEGASYLRDCLFNTNGVTLTAVAPFVGLLVATPTVTTTLPTIVEATGGSYVRKQPAWTATNPGSANNTASAASWTAVGTSINAVTHLFLTDSVSGTLGKFLTFALLTGGPYTVNIASTLNVTYTWSVA